MQALQSNVLFVQFVAIVLLIVIDVVVTVAVAIQRGKFEWAKLLEFLRTNVVPYALIWGVLGAAGYGATKLAISDATLTSFAVLVDIVYALIVARLAASILLTFKDMGIPGPPDAS
jgi:hypothetical protein